MQPLIISSWVEAIAVTVPLLTGVLVAFMSQTRKDVKAVRSQVVNDHASPETPSNLRVQMDEIQSEIGDIMTGHAEFRENILMLITELRTVQKQNGDLMAQLADEDRRLASRIDTLIDRRATL